MTFTLRDATFCSSTTKAARSLFFLMSFPFLYIFNSLQSSLTVYIFPSCLIVKETAEIETGRQKSPAGTVGPGKHTAKPRFGLEK